MHQAARIRAEPIGAARADGKRLPVKQPGVATWILVYLLSLAGLAGSASAADKSSPELLLAVVPQLAPTEMHAHWAPFSKRLAREIGTPIRLQVFSTMTDFEQSFQTGEPDLVYLNPYQQVVARRARGYVPLVREGLGNLSGMLVVARDGPIRALEDLQDKTIVFPDPNAFGASLYMRALLTERHGLRFTATYVNTHSNVYRHVLTGLAAAGGGINVSLRQEPPEAREALRVLYETPSVAPHPLSAHPRVPAELRAAVTRSVLKMAGDDAGRALLAEVNLRAPVTADYARDYGVLERLKLEKYYVHRHAR